MTDSASDPGQRGSMRAGTRDRDATAQMLQEAYAEGRLTSDEHDERLSRCYSAVTMADLAALTADLPDSAPAGSTPVTPGASDRSVPAPQPAGSSAAPISTGSVMSRSGSQKSVRNIWIGWLALSAFMVFVWAFSGMGGFWPVWVIVPTGIGAFVTTFTRGDRSG